MNTFNLIWLFLSLLIIIFGIYKFFKNTQKLPFLTLNEAKPFLDQIDSKHEKRVRKIWLISFLLAIVLSTVNVLTGLIELLLKTPLNIYLYPLIMVLAVAPGSWMLYHCAYKKKGTAWLMLVIFIRTIVLLVSIVKILGQASLLGPLEWLYVALPLSIDIFFWGSCIELYRINSKTEYQIVLALKHKYGADANGFCL